MSIVSAKCPNCGATIQLDNERIEGFCSYCGSKVKVLDAINLVKIDKSGDLKNYLSLANSAIEAHNGEEALSYANKVLELDSSNSEAWYTKMLATGLLAILKDLKCSEVIAAGRKAIEFSSNEKTKNDVYGYFLTKCLNDLKFCMNQLQDTKAIKDLYQANCAVNAFKATENTIASDMIADLILTGEPLILSLRLAVPDSEIAKNEVLANLTGEVAKQWVYYQNAINERFNVYGAAMNDDALGRYINNLNRIKQGLPDDKQNVIDESSLTNEQKGPCYVATAVYGSYNCPEVWTLRRFRDFVLAETWYGRLFVRTYYAISPSIVKVFGEANWFKHIWKPILDKFVSKLQANGFKSTPYSDKEW